VLNSVKVLLYTPSLFASNVAERSAAWPRVIGNVAEKVKAPFYGDHVIMIA